MIPEEKEFKDLYLKYKNKTRKTIDSLFYVESKKYRIIDKLKLNRSYEQDIKNLFLSIRNWRLTRFEGFPVFHTV